MCSDKGPQGFLCVLKQDHEGECLSIDNRVLWEGTPGAPVRWERVAQAVAPPASQPKPIADLSNKVLGYTGIPCDQCGSLNTVRTGKCLSCMDCLNTGECG